MRFTDNCDYVKLFNTGFLATPHIRCNHLRWCFANYCAINIIIISTCSPSWNHKHCRREENFHTEQESFILVPNQYEVRQRPCYFIHMVSSFDVCFCNRHVIYASAKRLLPWDCLWHEWYSLTLRLSMTEVIFGCSEVISSSIWSWNNARPLCTCSAWWKNYKISSVT